MKLFIFALSALFSATAAFAVPPQNLCPANSYQPTVSKEYVLGYTTTDESYAKYGVPQDIMDNYCDQNPYWDGNVQVTTECLVERAPAPMDRTDICIMTERFAFESSQ